ncbi:putative Carrier domain-containing protein [Seiridium cardinale]|uniref:Carrier domain-containing protein n=1 Tax=Seiridium cardinale TaxID=138064 RepID=A0ABR2Y0G6_9PEZI
MTTSVSDGNVGRRQRTLLPHMVDRLASDEPDSIFGMWPIASASYDAGYQSVTYAELANMVNGLAQWLVDNLGPGQHGEPLAYVGPNDARIPALLLAAIKAGYGLFLTSPRNSAAAHQALFNSLACTTLITPEPTPPPALPIIEAVKARHLKVPSVDELRQSIFPAYVYSKTIEEGSQDPLMIIHTSGSTGVPKPLVWTQETGLRHQNSSACQPPDVTPSLEKLYLGKRVLVTVPPFHGAGLGQSILYAIPFGNTIIAPAATGIVSAESLVKALEHAPADVALLVPSVVAELARNPTLLRFCAEHLELIVYIGGDLPQDVGDVVAAQVPLRCQWGASEVGMPQQLIPSELDPRKDWRYVRFHPCAGATFDKVADGIYELVIQRKASLGASQTTFTIRGKTQLNEYRTGDLFAPHPTVPDTWSWKARADDIIVFLNGEKTNPVSMEQHVTARNPELVRGAIVIGTKRFQAALLVEPVHSVDTTAQQASLIERVWPSIEEANRESPAHARVEKSLVFVTAPDRPLIRAGKGTLQRAASLALYEAEINELYEREEMIQEDEEFTTTGALGDTSLVSQRIRDAVSRTTGWTSLDDSADIFERGMDSLQALRLTRALRRALHWHGLALTTVYQNPTVSQLASVTRQARHSNDRDIMEPLLATYCQLIQKIPIPTSSHLEEARLNIVLTGSTGTIGTMILLALLARKGIGHVYCLNRDSDGGRLRQSERLATLGVAKESWDDRVTFLRADLARPGLRLDEKTYESLCKRAHCIIHNAWPVNFYLALSSFRPQLAGMVNLFALAAAAVRPMRFLFISTVGAVAGLGPGAGPAAESIIRSLDAAHASGYARSKLLSELLCNAASRHLGIPVRVARVGQVAGQVGAGAWNRTEWLPSLVVSGFHLGCLPEDLGPRFSEVDWIPSDLLADAVVDLITLPSWAQRTASDGADVYNLRNPSTTTWNTLLPALQDAARAYLSRGLEIVSSATWLQRLQESSDPEAHDVAALVASNPAYMLLPFYRDGLWVGGPAIEPMSVKKSIAVSPTLQDMPSVHYDWMRKWVEDWMA